MAAYDDGEDGPAERREAPALDMEPEGPIVTRVDIHGPLEQRSGYHDMCAGWSDGHDAITERMIAALEDGDVVMVIDSPGGSYAGCQEGIRRVLEVKQTLGRHVTAVADEMIGSAAYWWAACVADEIYGPESMIVGSIGARSLHGSFAGQLAKEGIEVTHFSWPPGGGKIAFAPELPLSDIGRERGERDVAIAGEAFAAAVGPCRGLSRDEIVELGADAMHGEMALSAGLVDGIASLEDVMDYALALAGTSTDGETDMRTAIVKPGARAEVTPPDDKNAEGEDGKPTPDKHECAKCGAANDDDAKFCDKCGEQMHASAEGENAEGEGDEEGEGEDGNGKNARADDDTKPEDARAASDGEGDDEEEDPKKKTPKEGARSNLARSGSSLAAIFGLRENASAPQLKRAALSFVSLGRAVMAATDTKNPDEAAGAFKALADDAGETGRLRSDLRASKKREEYQERMDLLRKLSSANVAGYTRGELFVDREVGGKVVTGPAPIYAEMKIGTLRGFVQGKLANPTGKGKAKASPFEPSQIAAREGAQNARVEIAITTPFIAELASRSTASAEQLARTAAALEAQNQGD